MPSNVWTVTDRRHDDTPIEYSNNFSEIRVRGGTTQWHLVGPNGQHIRGDAGRRRCFKSAKAAMAAVDAMPEGFAI